MCNFERAWYTTYFTLNSKFQKSLDAEISSDSPNPPITLNRRSDNATTGSHTAEFEHASASPLPRGEPALSQIPATVLCFSFSNLRSNTLISKPLSRIQRTQNFCLVLPTLVHHNGFQKIHAQSPQNKTKTFRKDAQREPRYHESRRSQ